MTSAARSADWFADNDAGLRLAAGGGWQDAAQAFESAVHRLTKAGAGEPEAHEALALVLGNLANACFRVGRVEDAIVHGQRACALREALAGEDALTVARMRSDLAVMLVAAGRADEAPALLDRAIAAIDRSAGDEDPHLLPVLENAARAALLLGQPSNAEPVLLRLHALLDAHGGETTIAERLLVDVAATRSASMATSPAGSRDAVPPADEAQTEPEGAAQPLAASDGRDDEPAREEVEREDQPLLDAVRVTDALLRTTPSGVPAIRDEAARSAPASVPLVDPETKADTASVSSAPVAPSAFDDFDGELELVPLREPEITPPSLPAAGSPPPASGSSSLGFEVHYGVPLDSDPMRSPEAPVAEPGHSDEAQPVAGGGAAADPIGDLELIDLSTTPAPALEPIGVESEGAVPDPERLQPESVATSAGLAAPSPAVPASVVLPSAGGGQPMARPTTTAEDRELATLRSRLAEAQDGGGAARRPPRVAGGEQKARGRGAAIGGILALAAAAAAGWFLFRGGFI